MTTNVRDAMTTNVYTILRTGSLTEAAALLRRHKISGVPVMDSDQKIVGVLSEKDIARGVSGGLGIGEPDRFLDLLLESTTDTDTSMIIKLRGRMAKMRVEEAMSSPAVCVAPEGTIEEAAELMRSKGINRLPVAEGDRLIGILTRSDLIEAVAGPVEESSAPAEEPARAKVAP